MPDVTLGGAFLVGRAGVFCAQFSTANDSRPPTEGSRVPVKHGVEVQPLTYVR
jgi:hypothetical protein